MSFIISESNLNFLPILKIRMFLLFPLYIIIYYSYHKQVLLDLKIDDLNLLTIFKVKWVVNDFL
jgi:hypothetical protein